MTYLLGIDAGGTKSRARVVDAAGNVLGEARGGPGNARVGLQALMGSLMHVASKAFANAGLEEQAFDETFAGIGIAGISRPGMQQSISAQGFPFARVSIDTDAAIANLGAHGGRDGAVLILGTGSVGYIRTGNVIQTIGGYGFPISDEGSGAALGLSAMRHALRALDGRTLPTPLSAAVTEQFNHKAEQAVAWMDNATPGDYARMAPMVLDYAEKGDEIAHNIVEDAVRHIERFIETIFDKGADRCALAGGLAQRLQPWLRARTAARLTPVLGDPLDGALILAGSGDGSAG
ncbi:MAG: BadF/BadG/BcrA/BcrD ATPase family protein [Pseudomonadota bacterium]